ncbi:MAG: helix-turn-helix transcriptional regulator [Clostridia bacterium]|nr:helix-turn-helix transcriptional regulator [Clostridia bacterium]
MTEETKKKSIQRLKELREKNGNITQEEFAEKIGVSPDTIRKIEQGKVKLTLDNAISIKNAFGVSLDWLYGVADDMNDEASTTLLALRKYFNICTKKHECGDSFFTVTIEENLRDFLLEYDNAEHFVKEKGIPEAGREAWLNDIKARYNEKIKAGVQGDKIDYRLTEFSDIKVITKGANTANPPVNMR